jgi:hypothetical protein
MEGGKKERSMFKIFKSMLQILIGIALVLQLAGCFYWDHDHDRDRHYDHHDDHSHDSGIDVHVHG